MKVIQIMTNFHERHCVHFGSASLSHPTNVLEQQELFHIQSKDHLEHSKKWTHTRMGSHCFSSVCDVLQLLKIEAFAVSAKAMSEKRFVILDSSVEEYVESLENKNTQGKTKRDVKLLNEKKEERELSAITPEDLDIYLAEFIRSVRSKDGGEYEPPSLRGLLASVERHLKKNCYPASIFSDRQFELTPRCLQSKQKELRKAGRGNKDKADRPRNRRPLRGKLAGTIFR